MFISLLSLFLSTNNKSTKIWTKERRMGLLPAESEFQIWATLVCVLVSCNQRVIYRNRFNFVGWIYFLVKCISLHRSVLVRALLVTHVQRFALGILWIYWLLRLPSEENQLISMNHFICEDINSWRLHNKWMATPNHTEFIMHG